MKLRLRVEKEGEGLTPHLYPAKVDAFTSAIEKSAPNLARRMGEIVEEDPGRTRNITLPADAEEL